MSGKSLKNNQIGEVLNSLADLEVDSGEELICDEDSEEDKLLSNEGDPSSSSSEENSDEYDDDYITSRDGTKWRKTPPSAQQKTLKRNILRVAPELTDISKNIDTPQSAFQLLFDDSVLNMMIDCSEKKATHLGHSEWKFERESLEYFYGNPNFVWRK